MTNDKRFLVDVGLKDLPFPMRAISKADSQGQPTVANISITARIMREFEAHWIDKFIQLVHHHFSQLGTQSLRDNILDYLKALKAATVRIDFDYPFFIKKLTPISKEPCLVRYLCTYSVSASAAKDETRVLFKMEIPVISTYPASDLEKPGGLFGQLSVVNLEIESTQDFYPEDLVEMVEAQALSPVYSFLTEPDQHAIIEKVHSEVKTSVVMLDQIKTDLARKRDIDWYSVTCSNYGMLHPYNTFIGTEKSRWVPLSGYEEEI